MNCRHGAFSGRQKCQLPFSLRLLWEETDRHVLNVLAIALFLVLVSSSIAALSPVLLKMLVDSLTGTRQVEALAVTSAFLLVAYAASHLAIKSLGELRSLAVSRADQRIQRRLSQRLFAHMMSLPLRFHTGRRTGAVNQALTNGLVGYRLLLQLLISTALPVVLELAAMGAVLTVLGQPIFIAIFAFTLLAYIAAFLVGAAKLAERAKAVSAAHIDANAVFIDSMLNYETVKYFTAETNIQKRLAGAFGQTEVLWARFASCKMVSGLTVAAIFSLSIAASLYTALREVSHGAMSVGDFVLVNVYTLQILAPMERFGFAFLDFARGLAFIERMGRLLRQEPESVPSEIGRALLTGPGEVTFERISFSYSAERQVLNDASFTVPPGKTVAVVGASGSGKSSLIRLLLRLVEPDSGRILVDGVPISEVSTVVLREAIAVVPQNTILFNDSIGYNIGFGRPGTGFEDIVAAARLADIHDFIIEQPEGYDTIVGEHGVKLSGGEKQRIAIARAVMKKPRIFVFDEASSCLDAGTETRVLHNIDRAFGKTTMLVITHRLTTIAEADEILVLNKGRIIERGTHRELVQRDTTYQTMWRVQTCDRC